MSCVPRINLCFIKLVKKGSVLCLSWGRNDNMVFKHESGGISYGTIGLVLHYGHWAVKVHNTRLDLPARECPLWG